MLCNPCFKRIFEPICTPPSLKRTPADPTWSRFIPKKWIFYQNTDFYCFGFITPFVPSVLSETYIQTEYIQISGFLKEPLYIVLLFALKKWTITLLQWKWTCLVYDLDYPILLFAKTDSKPILECTVVSRYLEVDWTTFYKFKLSEVQINLHFG